ncbi:DUF559 domain-containing protein [Microbacteriaceae bacterium VKM Ac-2854]|nr:DUF559 domain-containing protein [Microbacteriaceae bacterium VKM Ac-2854]
MLESIVTSRQLTALSIDPSARGFERLRPGWFAQPNATAIEKEAARIGGRISCISLLEEIGAFRPPEKRLHLAVKPTASRIEPGDGVALHWGQRVQAPSNSLVRVDPSEALGHALQCQPADMAIAIVDSILQKRLMTRRDVDAVFAAMPRRLQRLRSFVDAQSESGIESLTRFRLAAGGIDCELQVVISGVGRVDLLIDGWLVIELDGGTHDTDDAIARDRIRDVESQVGGYTVLRFRYRQVIYDWDYVETKIRARLARGATR